MEHPSLDIIIPSFRVSEHIIQQILDLSYPDYLRVSVYLVIDNPNAKLPLSLSSNLNIKISINEVNLGAAATRNRGIKESTGEWILFLDDDIIPERNLLHSYAAAILANPEAVGFAGVTAFPPPFNPATHALVINGSVSHFQAAKYHASLPWAPTANVIIRRKFLHPHLFDPSLINAEDIDMLVRSSIFAGQQYMSVPDAVVSHPWWNGGRIQTKRMISYGRGACQISLKDPIKNYTFIDFFNTSESLFVLLILLPVALIVGKERWIILLALAVVTSEFLTNYMKAISVGKTRSLLVACNLMWVKNCYEAGGLFQTVISGRLDAFARRIDAGFSKLHPSHFRTNRWKIFKMVLLGLMILIGAIAFGAAQ